MVASLRLGCATLLFLPFLRIRNDRWQRSCQTDCLRSHTVRRRCMVATCWHFNTCHHLVAIFSIPPVYVVLIYNFQKARFTLFYLLAALCSVGGAFVTKAKTIPGRFLDRLLLNAGSRDGICFRASCISTLEIFKQGN